MNSYTALVIAIVALLVIVVFLIWSKSDGKKRWFFEVFGLVKTGSEQENEIREVRPQTVMKQDGEDNYQKAPKGSSANLDQDGKRNRQIIE